MWEILYFRTLWIKILQILSKPRLHVLHGPILAKRVDVDLRAVTLLENGQEMLDHGHSICRRILGVEIRIGELRIRFANVDGIVELKYEVFQVFFRLNRIKVDFTQIFRGMIGAHGTGQMGTDANHEIVQFVAEFGVRLVFDLVGQGMQHEPRRLTPDHFRRDRRRLQDLGQCRCWHLWLYRSRTHEKHGQHLGWGTVDLSRKLHAPLFLLYLYKQKYKCFVVYKNSNMSVVVVSNNDVLKRQIREWLTLDNELRRIKKEVRQRTLDKERLTAGLIDQMKRKNIDMVNLADGHLRYESKTVKKPVTQKMLLNLLATYFDGNAEEANKVNTFILDHREETVTESLVRKITNVQQS